MALQRFAELHISSPFGNVSPRPRDGSARLGPRGNRVLPPYRVVDPVPASPVRTRLPGGDARSIWPGRRGTVGIVRGWVKAGRKEITKANLEGIIDKHDLWLAPL